MAEPSFTTVDTEFSVDLHPSALRNVSTSVKQLLQELVLTYRPEYSGVVMGYQNVRIRSSAAPVHTFFPYTHVKVSAQLLVLEIRKNQIIDGVVHQVGVEYVGMKVLGGLTAVIHKDELQPKFDHSLAYMGWKSKTSEHVAIKSGCTVRFLLKRIDTAQDKFILVGSTNSDQFSVAAAGQNLLQNAAREPQVAPNGSRKRRTPEPTEDSQEKVTPPRLGNAAGSSAVDSHEQAAGVENKPKKKKRKKLENSKAEAAVTQPPSSAKGSGRTAGAIPGNEQAEDRDRNTKGKKKKSKKGENKSQTNTQDQVAQQPVTNGHIAPLSDPKTPAFEPKKKKKKSKHPNAAGGEGVSQDRVGSGVQKKAHTNRGEGEEITDKKKRKKKKKSE